MRSSRANKSADQATRPEIPHHRRLTAHFAQHGPKRAQVGPKQATPMLATGYYPGHERLAITCRESQSDRAPLNGVWHIVHHEVGEQLHVTH